ncbi:ligase-associated DNA damage response exonuclease [Radicibacter daui]|uniref:ligase-associated DNA damage response exonuclease n=1 Tax=Radicibacter daui TaxID=3064829 RepID=UPI004046A34B
MKQQAAATGDYGIARLAGRDPARWIYPTPVGLYVEPAGLYIDPMRVAERAIVTHGHSDHARGGHRHVLATPETLAVMGVRKVKPKSGQALASGESVTVGGVRISLHPAGHVLGSAQVRLEWQGEVVVVSGDYKRAADPTCAPFELVPCHTFVTEATFGLPVYRHPPAEAEIGRLLASLTLFPERAHLVGAYSLGKAQRVIRLLRLAGHERPIWVHQALWEMCALYQSVGIDLGELRLLADARPAELAGEVLLAPPNASAEGWLAALPEPVRAVASGWVRVRKRATQQGAELALVISDHADWDELRQTIVETGCERLWVTHGEEAALIHFARQRGIEARALSLVGYSDGEDEKAEAGEGDA